MCLSILWLWNLLEFKFELAEFNAYDALGDKFELEFLSLEVGLCGDILLSVSENRVLDSWEVI